MVSERFACEHRPKVHDPDRRAASRRLREYVNEALKFYACGV
jgi:hypothetical protein